MSSSQSRYDFVTFPPGATSLLLLVGPKQVAISGLHALFLRHLVFSMGIISRQLSCVLCGSRHVHCEQINKNYTEAIPKYLVDIPGVCPPTLFFLVT